MDKPIPEAVDALRREGWAVAVHNDYRLQGEQHTFWLFTKGGSAVKGEGRTDAEALSQVREQVAALTAAQQQGQAVAWQERYLDIDTGEWSQWRYCAKYIYEAHLNFRVPEIEARALYTAPPPSAPVGVEVKILARDVHYAIRDDGLAPASPADDAAMRNAILRVLASNLAQQPAAVDGAMAERFCRRWYEITGRSLERAHVLASLDSALATQHQEPTT